LRSNNISWNNGVEGNMLRKNEKGIGLSATLIIGFAIYTLIILLVVIFFLLFQYNVELEIRDEYLWNKVQDVPLNLLSLTFDREPFVSKMNKFYYGFLTEDEKNDFIDETRTIITDQLFYLYTGCPPDCPIGYVIRISDILISQTKTVGCQCKRVHATRCECSGECPNAGKSCGVEVKWGPFTKVVEDDGKCYKGIEFGAEFPFPLAFNGTNKLTYPVFYYAVG